MNFILVLMLIPLCSLYGAGNAEICHPVQYVERGSRGTIYCSFRVDSHGIYWYDTSDATKHPMFYLEDNVKSGSGFTSGEFDIHANGSLIINTVSLGHEHDFTVLQLQRADSDPIVLTIQVIVTVHPVLPYPFIFYCNGSKYCYHYAKDSSPVVCFVNKTRPPTQLTWNLRTTNDDREVVFHTEYIPEGKLFTSLITVDQSVVNSINFQLLVCKAKPGEPSLVKEDAIVLIEVHTPRVDFSEAVVEKHHTNQTINLPCSLDESLFFVWKRRINGTNFKLLAHGSYGSTVCESNQYSLKSNNALSIPFLSDELQGIYVCFYGNGTDKAMSVYNVSIFDIKGIGSAPPHKRLYILILPAIVLLIGLVVIMIKREKIRNCWIGYFSVPTQDKPDVSNEVSIGVTDSRQELNRDEPGGSNEVSKCDTDTRQELNQDEPGGSNEVSKCDTDTRQELNQDHPDVKQVESTTINASLVKPAKTPAMYDLDFSSGLKENEELKMRKCDIGACSETRDNKVVLLVGETGAGKTTLINALANYLLGVTWHDDFRYQLPLVDEEKNQSHIDSQTKWISVYTFHEHKNEMNCDITIIDTPGLGDTNGESRDKEIMTQIRWFLSNEIDHLNLIAYVKKASDLRKTNRETYITNLVTNLFGKDVAKSIYLLGTHASVIGNEKFRDTAKDFGFTSTDTLFFNNEHLYLEKGAENYRTIEPQWTMGWKSFISFTNVLSTCPDIGLELTREVGTEKKQLEEVISNFPKLLKSKVILYNSLRAQEEALLLKSTENEQLVYQYEETYEETVKTNISDGKMAIVCLQCENTCCYPCRASYVWTCNSIRPLASILGCEKCESRCSSLSHFKKNFMYERKLCTRIITDKDMEKKLKSNNNDNIVQALKNVKESQENKKAEIFAQVEIIRNRIERINRLSLASASNTVKQLLQNMITSETNKAESGWEDRVKFLTELASCEK